MLFSNAALFVGVETMLIAFLIAYLEGKKHDVTFYISSTSRGPFMAGIAALIQFWAESPTFAIIVIAIAFQFWGLTAAVKQKKETSHEVL